MEQLETPLATPPSEENTFTSYEELAERVILNGFSSIISSERGRSNSSSSASSRNSSSKVFSNIIYRKAFLLAYRLYSTPSKLFAVWKSHFDHHLNNPKLIRTSETDIQINNILEFIYEWLAMYLSSDFSKSMRVDILALVDQLHPDAKNRFKLLLVKSIHAHNQNRFISHVPKPPGDLDHIKKFSDLSPESVATCLTFVDFELFRKVLPKELLNQNWQNANKAKYAPNVTLIISRFNEVSYFVATEIMIQKDVKMRKKVLKKFIKIAEICTEMNNFNTCMAILSGLNNVAVQRLKNLWDLLSEKTSEIFQRLDTLMRSQHNFRAYREELKHRSPPVLPYFGIYLRDLIFTTTGNEPYLTTGGINYEFIQMLWHTVEEIQFYQSRPYKLDIDWAAEQVLVSRPLRVFDDETLYSLSKKSEPASREASFLDLNEISSESSFASVLKKAASRRRMTLSPGDLEEQQGTVKPARSRSLGDKRNSGIHLNKVFGESSQFLKILDPNLVNWKVKNNKKEEENNGSSIYDEKPLVQ